MTNQKAIEIQKYPNLIVRNGIGTFNSGDFKFEATFEITCYPEKTIIETEVQNGVNYLATFISNDCWNLNGLISQEIHISARNLLITNISDKIIFEALSEVKFGDQSIDTFTHAEFPLIGFYKGKIDLSINGWNIKSIGHSSETTYNGTIGKRWNLQLEGLTLTLDNDESNTENFLSKANNISLLLSLAQGNTVIFNRQLYYKNDKLVLEIWRRKAGYHFGVEPCISESQINRYLERTLGSFEKWSLKKKDIFYSTINFINSSSHGFLEDRLLRLSIAWESLATKWIKGNVLARVELDLLKEFLRISIDSYNLPDNLDKDFIKDRIVKALDWEKLYNSLMNLIGHYKLNYEKLQLDFKTLIKIRNEVAHSGKFRKKYSGDKLADLIFYNKTGLQVLLLVELGYDSVIEFQNDKWVTSIKIDELLNPTTT